LVLDVKVQKKVLQVYIIMLKKDIYFL
jgi:hypothetical protein